MAQQRLKDRLTAYIKTDVASNEQIVSSTEATEFLKQKFNEYTRKDSRAFER